MAQGKKYDDDIREKAHSLLMSGNNIDFVAKQLNLPYSTVKTWKDQLAKKVDNFAQLREKRKEEFIEGCWDNINLTEELLKRRLNRAVKSEKELDALLYEIMKLSYTELSGDERRAINQKMSALKIEDVGKIAVVLGTLYDKQALANKEATAIVEGNIIVKKFEDF